MSKETLISYLEESLEKTMGEYDFAIDWSKKERTIKISVRLFADNNKKISFEDTDQIISQEEVLEFVDSAIFYGKTREDAIHKENYLASVPFDEKKGLEKGVIDAFSTCLKEMMDQAQEEFLDFLEETALVTAMENLDDNQIKKYFSGLSQDQQEILLSALEKEELVFEFDFNQESFESSVVENLKIPEGKELLEYPLY